MKLDFNDFLTELDLSPETAELLREHNIHTMRDLGCAFNERSLKTFLSTEQRIEVVEAFWVWVMQSYETEA